MKNTFQRIKLRNIICLTAIFLSYIYGYSQDRPIPIEQKVDVLNHMKVNYEYGVDLYTGKPSISIPLYTYSDPDFNIPINLYYVSTGYKTREPVGQVGLGWDLSVGGYVTRKVNSFPDEDSLAGYGMFGFFTVNGGIKRDYENLFKKGKGIDDIKSSYRDTYIWYREDGSPLYGETTPDVFSFQFGDHKGDFIVGIDTVYVFNTNHPAGEYSIVIKPITLPASNDRKNIQIKITTGKGDVYTFQAQSGFYRIWSGLDKRVNFDYSFLNPSSMNYWPLVLIESQAKNRKVNFTYASDDDIAQVGERFYMDLFEWESSVRREGIVEENYGKYAYGIKNSQLNKPLLKKISIEDNGTEINFSYEKRDRIPAFDMDSLSLKNFSLLKGITITHTSNPDPIKTFKLNYVQNTNGKPTHFLETVDVSGLGTYKLNYNGVYDRHFPYYSEGIDHWGYYNNAGIQGFPKIRFTNNNEELIAIHETDRSANSTGSMLGMLSQITYPTNGYTRFYFEGHTCGYMVAKDKTRNNTPYIKEVDNKEVGGLRIKRIASYSNKNDSITRSFSYDFLDTYTGETGGSTGFLVHSPRYHNRMFDGAKYWSLSSGNTYSWYNSYIYTEDKSHIGYFQVSETLSDGSMIISEFTTYNDFPDTAPDKSVIKDVTHLGSLENNLQANNFFTKYDSWHNERGRPAIKYHYGPNLKLIYAEEYIYDYSKPLAYYITAERAYSHYYMSKHIVDQYPVSEIYKTYYNERGENINVEIERFAYNKYNQVVEKTKSTNSGQLHEQVKTQYIGDIPSDKLTQTQALMKLYKNMLGTSIRTQTSRNGYITKGVKFDYTTMTLNGIDYINLNAIQQTELNRSLFNNNDFDFDSYLKTTETYDYDRLGRLIGVTDRTGLSTAYIWGSLYADLAGIVENVKFNKLYDGIIDYETTLTPYIRKAILELPGTTVTFFDQKPLIGLNSKTDNRGIVTYFDYDEYNRLKDSYYYENNDLSKKRILKSFRYHYINE